MFQKIIFKIIMVIVFLLLTTQYIGRNNTLGSYWSSDVGCNFESARSNVSVDPTLLYEVRYLNNSVMMSQDLTCQFDQIADLTKNVVMSSFSRCISKKYGRFDTRIYIIPDSYGGWTFYSQPFEGTIFKIEFPYHCR